MNRVRIVAATAAVLGVAVVAGTRFQQSQQPGDPGARQASLAPAPATTDLTLLAGATQVQPAALRPQAEVLTSGTTPGSSEPAGEASGEPRLAMARTQDAASSPSAAPESSAQPRVDTSSQISAASILSAADLLATSRPAPQTEPAALRADPTAPIATTSPGNAPASAPGNPAFQSELGACAVWVVVTASAGAILDTSVYAPCDRDAVVQVTHASLMFDSRIGADGQMTLAIPALIDEARVTVAFDDGRSQSDTTFVPDLTSVARVALQWQSPSEISLHAYAFDAQFDDPGHVWAQNPMPAGNGAEGFLTTLGDQNIAGGHRIQVYSYASGSHSGAIRLEIEAPVEANCGQRIVAEAIELHAASPIRSRAIELDMPECDGNGGYVVVPGILPDLQISALD